MKGIQLGVELMDNHMILQMLLPFLPTGNHKAFLAFQEAAELQQLILSHAGSGREDWQVEMLQAIRPKLPERNRHMADILIKFMELSSLLEKGSTQYEHRDAL